jgi:hypothetical protein
MAWFFGLLTLLMAVTFLGLQGIIDPMSTRGIQVQFLVGACLFCTYVVMISLFRDLGRPTSRNDDDQAPSATRQRSRGAANVSAGGTGGLSTSVFGRGRRNTGGQATSGTPSGGERARGVAKRR